jgi:hypothetical protein
LTAGSATIALAAASTTAQLALAAGNATIALAGSEVFTAALALPAGSATIALAGNYETGALTLTSGAATIAFAASASGGATSSGVLTLGSDTFTLAFTGALVLTPGLASIAFAGTSNTATLALPSGGATLAFAATSDGATAVLSLAAGAARLAFAGQAAINGVLTLLAGSANAPLLHLVAPTLAIPVPVWSGMALSLDARRTAGLVRFVPRTADGAALPAGALIEGVYARVLLRRVSGGAVIETVGAVTEVADPRDGAACLGVECAWPDGLPAQGLYYAAIELYAPGVAAQRVPEGERFEAVRVG